MLKLTQEENNEKSDNFAMEISNRYGHDPYVIQAEGNESKKPKSGLLLNAGWKLQSRGFKHPARQMFNADRKKHLLLLFLSVISSSWRKRHFIYQKIENFVFSIFVNQSFFFKVWPTKPLCSKI
jgi:hypothetical protein